MGRDAVKKAFPMVILLLLSSSTFTMPRYIERKKQNISQHARKLTSRRMLIREEIRRQREERETNTNRCFPIDRRELITMACGLASLGITTLRIVLELVK